MEDGHGLLLDGRVSKATGIVECDLAQVMLADLPGWSDHGRRRHGFRHGGLYSRPEGTQCDPARHPEHEQPPLGDRRPDHWSFRLCREPADRGGTSLDQGGGSAAPRQGPGRLAVHPGGRGLQPDPACPSWCRRDDQAPTRSQQPLGSRDRAPTNPSLYRSDLAPEAGHDQINHYFRSLLKWCEHRCPVVIQLSSQNTNLTCLLSSAHSIVKLSKRYQQTEYS